MTFFIQRLVSCITQDLKDLDITERIFELEYSSGESIILLRQRRDIASAILFVMKEVLP